MSFNDDVRLDPSQVEDRRGGGMSRGTKIGGGIGGGILVLVLSLLGIGNPQLIEDIVGGAGTAEQSQGTAPGAAWTHGSSAQRQKWFYQGYQTGDINQCDTFAVPTP